MCDDRQLPAPDRLDGRVTMRAASFRAKPNRFGSFGELQHRSSNSAMSEHPIKWLPMRPRESRHTPERRGLGMFFQFQGDERQIQFLFQGKFRI